MRPHVWLWHSFWWTGCATKTTIGGVKNSLLVNHLSNLEASSFSQQQVLSRNSDVWEFHFGMAGRSVVIAKDSEWSQQADTWRVHGDQYHWLGGREIEVLCIDKRVMRCVHLLFMSRWVGISLPHEDAYLAPRIHCSWRRNQFAIVLTNTAIRVTSQAPDKEKIIAIWVKVFQEKNFACRQANCKFSSKFFVSCIILQWKFPNKCMAAVYIHTWDPPFVPVDYVTVSVSDDGALNVGGIGGRHCWLRHGKTRPHLPSQQRMQPLLLTINTISYNCG